MDKEKRNYLKPYRCVGGLMLFLSVFSMVLTVSAIPLSLIISPLLSSETAAGELISLLTAGVTVYTYYVGYRIFIKKYHPELFDFRPVESHRLISCIIMMVLTFLFMRFSWAWYFRLLGVSVEAGEEKMTVIMTIYSIVVAPVAEEVVFRGWAISLLRRYGVLPAILFSALAFGLYHGNIYQIPPAFMIGLAFGYLAIKYDSLWPTIILHVISNTMSVLVSVDETPFFNIYLAGTLLLIGIILITNIRKLKDIFSQIPVSMKLAVSSIAFLLFTAINVAMMFLS